MCLTCRVLRGQKTVNQLCDGGQSCHDRTVSCGSQIKSRVSYSTWHRLYIQTQCVPSEYQLSTFPAAVRGQTVGPSQGEGEGHHWGGQQEEPRETEPRHQQQWPLQGQGGEKRQRALGGAATAQQQAPGKHREERDCQQGHGGCHGAGSQ